MNARSGVTSKCQKCQKDYYVPKCRISKSKYCSRRCHDLAQQTSERKEIKCQRCGEVFETKKDHGRWPKYCSVDCYTLGQHKPLHKKCPICESMFLAKSATHETEDGLRIHCSRKCANEAQKSGTTRTCVCCGQEFYLSISRAQKRRDNGCCSVECQRKFYTEERNPNFKGGRYMDATTGERRVLFPLDNRVSRYISEHRLVAAKSIRRILERHEAVLHINNNKIDNHPDNLFICGSMSEMQRRIQGSLPWPKKSNLGEYK